MFGRPHAWHGGSALRPEAEHGGAYSFVVRYVVVWYLRGAV